MAKIGGVRTANQHDVNQRILSGKGLSPINAVDEKPASGSLSKYMLSITVDYADVDTAIEKVNRLVELLREASSIIDSLSAGKN